MTVDEIKQSVHDLKTHYASVSAVSFREKTFIAYTKRVLDTLTLILNLHIKKSELAEAMMEFLMENHILVNSTALCYTALPTHDVTVLICNIAYFVADQKKLNPVDILLPGIILESCNEAYPDVGTNTNLQCLLQTHILGSEGACLLPVKLITELDLAPESTRLNNPYFDFSKPVGNGFINTDEYQRLVAHSTLTQAVFDTKQKYELLTSDTSHLLGQLTQLCQQLTINSVSGRGEETNAASGAYPAIIAFMDYYTNLNACGFQLSHKHPEVNNLPVNRNMAYALQLPNYELYFINRFDEDRPVKKVTLGALKFGLSLISIRDEAEIPSGLSGNVPTLIQVKNTNQYIIYGCTSDQTWGFTELDAEVMSTLFPINCTPIRQRPLGNVPEVIYSNIAEKKAHTQTLALSLDAVYLSSSVETCSLAQLTAITDMTGHSFLAEKSAVPQELQLEINLLYDLARNPTKNTNATETLSTCIATRKSELLKKICGHETILCEISLSGAHKKSLIDDAQKNFVSAKACLTEALNTNSYTEGHDNLNLNIKLLAALNVKLDITSPADLDIIKTLSPTEITSVCSNPELRRQIIRQLQNLSNLIIFILDMPVEKLTAFLQANKEELLDQLVRYSRELSALLSPMDVEQCTVIITALKDRLSELIPSCREFNETIEHLLPEQRSVIFNALKDKWRIIIKSDKDLELVLTHLEPNECTAVIELLGELLPNIFKRSDFVKHMLPRLTVEQRMAVIDALENKWHAIITSSRYLKFVLEDLRPEEHARVINDMKDKLPVIIKTGIDLNFALRSLAAKKCRVIINIIKDKLPDIICSRHEFGNMLEDLTAEQCAAVIDAMNDQLTSIFKSGLDVYFMLAGRPLEQLTSVITAMKEQLPDIIKSGKELGDILVADQRRAFMTANMLYIGKFASDCSYGQHFGLTAYIAQQTKLMKLRMPLLIELLKDKLPDIIKSGKDFCDVLRDLWPEQRMMVFSALKDKLPHIIKSGRFFYDIMSELSPDERLVTKDLMKDKLPFLNQSGQDFGALLVFFSTEQRKTLINIKRSRSCVDATASKEEHKKSP